MLVVSSVVFRKLLTRPSDSASWFHVSLMKPRFWAAKSTHAIEAGVVGLQENTSLTSTGVVILHQCTWKGTTVSAVGVPEMVSLMGRIVGPATICAQIPFCAIMINATDRTHSLIIDLVMARSSARLPKDDGIKLLSFVKVERYGYLNARMDV